MNNINNSEYYKQKYLKYKFKYLEQKKLIGGVVPCPNKFGLFEKQSIIELLNKYNCNYVDIILKEQSLLYKINKEELENSENIKLLKAKEFPICFFATDEILKIKRMTQNMLMNGDYTIKDFEQCNLRSLLKLDLNRNFLIDIAKKIPKTERPSAHELLNFFTIKELIEIGINPILLYAIIKKNSILEGHYIMLESEGIQYLLQEYMKKNYNIFDDVLKKIISISNLKDIFKKIEKIDSQYIPWDKSQVLSFYTLEEQEKLKGTQNLDLNGKDNIVRFRYIDTAYGFKTAGFTPAELKDEFTPAELRAAGFTLDELRAAGFTPAELTAAGFSV